MIFSKIRIRTKKKNGFKEEYFIVIKREVKTYFKPNYYVKNKSDKPFEFEIYKVGWDKKFEMVNIRDIKDKYVKKYLVDLIAGRIKNILPSEDVADIIGIFGACNVIEYLSLNSHGTTRNDTSVLEDQTEVAIEYTSFSAAQINADFYDFYNKDNLEKSIVNLQKSLKIKEKEQLLKYMRYFDNIDIKEKKNKSIVTKINDIKLPYKLVLRNADEIFVENVNNQYGKCIAIHGEYIKKEKVCLKDLLVNKTVELKDTFNMNGIMDSRIIIFDKDLYNGPEIRKLEHVLEFKDSKVIGILTA